MKRIATEYYLMHKDIRVCLMEIDDMGNIHNLRRNAETAEHFPLGGQMNDMRFHEWWRDRAIPKSRNGAKPALQRLGYATTGSALVDNLALSLSDCYWIMPRGEELSWDAVNLFSNDFVDSFGELSIDPDATIDMRRLTRFKSAASQGELQKKWCIDKNGHRYMVKGNYGQSYQQSINEVFATQLHEKQGYDAFTPYALVRLATERNGDGLGCICYDYCGESVESISAWELLQTTKYRSNESFYYPLKRVCLSLGMDEEEFNGFIDYQIMTDYLLTNTDRHMNNIAVLRNPDTLELLGFAPIYDSGNSMFYDVTYERLGRIHLNDIKTHSFIERESRLLQYVHNRELVDIDRAEMDFSIYENDITERHIRIPLIKRLHERKCEALRAFQRGRDIWKGSF